MDSKKTLPITEARKNIFKIVEDVQKPGVKYTITEKGRPKAVVLSIDEYESLIETLEVMTEFPNLQKDVEEVNRALETGEYKKWATLEDIMAEHGYVLADKGDNKYNVGNKNRKKGKKKA